MQHTVHMFLYMLYMVLQIATGSSVHLNSLWLAVCLILLFAPVSKQKLHTCGLPAGMRGDVGFKVTQNIPWI